MSAIFGRVRNARVGTFARCSRAACGETERLRAARTENPPITAGERTLTYGYFLRARSGALDRARDVVHVREYYESRYNQFEARDEEPPSRPGKVARGRSIVAVGYT